ncbi:hypothetical protein N2603_37700 [Bradyrhizobium huanghuaihaiense]|uniref:hypothetical protein n=1 Tax=Bradyrhizobium huanghuaihaiense TaxID=990078 RepID=UPI0021AA874D|nr:hypothetical protein [Bradyrhizobium sp. CB3035]UWU75680.1 hypothetical protein N2603_37700 [Bradyrhizobium sp. CB3035]
MRRNDAELLMRGMRGTDASDALKGSLGVKISLDGFPRGTRTAISQEGSLLKEVQLNRGRSIVSGERDLITTRYTLAGSSVAFESVRHNRAAGSNSVG